MVRLTNSVNPCNISSSLRGAPALLKRYISFHCSPLDDCTHPHQPCDETYRCHSAMSPALFQQRLKTLRETVLKEKNILVWLTAIQRAHTEKKYRVPNKSLRLWRFCSPIGPGITGFEPLMGGSKQRIWVPVHHHLHLHLGLVEIQF